MLFCISPNPVYLLKHRTAFACSSLGCSSVHTTKGPVIFMIQLDLEEKLSPVYLTACLPACSRNSQSHYHIYRAVCESCHANRDLFLTLSSSHFMFLYFRVYFLVYFNINFQVNNFTFQILAVMQQIFDLLHSIPVYHKF